MAHPHKKHAHKNDPKWVGGLKQFVEKANDVDVTDTIRNYGGDKKATKDAAYDSKREKS